MKLKTAAKGWNIENVTLLIVQVLKILKKPDFEELDEVGSRHD